MSYFANPLVTAATLADGSVTTTKLADLAVVANKLANEAVEESKLGNGSVSTLKLQDLAVTTAKIGLLAVGSAQLQDAAITNAKIANLAVSNGKIQDAAITNAKIANAAITTAKIQDAAITSAKIQDLTALRYRTAASGERLEIRGDTGEGFIRMYNTAGTQVGIMGYSPVDWGGDVLGIQNTSPSGNVLLYANGMLDLAAEGSSGWGVRVASNANGVTGPYGHRLFVVDYDTGEAIFTVTTQNQVLVKVGRGDGAIDQSKPDYGFLGAESSGMMRHSSNRNFLVSEGAIGIEWRSNQVYLWGARNNTTASAANTLIQAADGRIFRSTSSKKYKTDIRSWDKRYSVLDLEPKLYRSTSEADGDEERLGLIAEDVAEKFPIATVEHEGKPDGIDWNMIVTGLLDEVKQLRREVDELASRSKS